MCCAGCLGLGLVDALGLVDVMLMPATATCCVWRCDWQTYCPRCFALPRPQARAPRCRSSAPRRAAAL